MEVVIIEKKTFEALLSGVETLTGKVGALCRRCNDKQMQKWLDGQEVCRLMRISPRTLQTLRDNRMIAFAQVSRKVGKFDIYAGCENIADYRQHDPILNADNPFSTGFNSMNVWGPLMGRKFYVGLRFNLY